MLRVVFVIIASIIFTSESLYQHTMGFRSEKHSIEEFDKFMSNSRPRTSQRRAQKIRVPSGARRIGYRLEEHTIEPFDRFILHKLRAYTPKTVPSIMNATQMIASHGYRAEEHIIETFDGYQLTIQRVLSFYKVPKETVILHHGLLGSSEDWLLLGPDRALPYLLSEKGYDVWLLNARGNKYSRERTLTFAKSFDFWEFSWHEIGLYDLPAAITFISRYTKSTNIHFVGHSMGATALLVLLSTLPEYNDMLESAVLLAPLAYMAHVVGPMRQLAEQSSMHPTGVPTRGEFLSDVIYSKTTFEKFCKGSYSSCSNPLLFLSNGGKEISDVKMMKDILAHVPAGASAKTVIHYMQLTRSDRFQMYDYGQAFNNKVYKQAVPPEYNLDSIRLTISLFSSSADWLANKEDISTLVKRLRNLKIRHIIEEPDFDHMDFVWSEMATDLVYYSLIEIISLRT